MPDSLLCVKEKMPRCGIIIHRRYALIVCRITYRELRSAGARKRGVGTHGCHRGRVKGYLYRGSPLHLKISRGTSRGIRGRHKATYPVLRQTLAISTTKRWSKRGDGNQRLTQMKPSIDHVAIAADRGINAPVPPKSSILNPT